MTDSAGEAVREKLDLGWADKPNATTNRANGADTSSGLESLTRTEFTADFVPPEFLIDDIIQRGYFYSLTAKTGHGKTAVALLIAYHIAAGVPLGGRQVERGNVLYLAGENPDDLRARMILADENYTLPCDDTDITVIPEIFDVGQSYARIKEKAEAVDGIKIVIVDTGAAYFQGDDDNSNTEMLAYAHDLRALTNLPGHPAVVALMHPIKNVDKDKLLPRGGGAFLNETDGNLTLWSEDRGETTTLHWQGKLRGPGFEPMAFRTEKKTSDILKDAKGRNMLSVVAFPMTDDEQRAAEDKAINDENALLEIMYNYPTETSFKQRCERLGWITEKGGAQKSRMQGVLGNLKHHTLVTNGRGEKWILTNKGKKEAEKIMGVNR